MVLTGAGAAWSAGMDLKEFFREGDALSPAARDIAQRTAVEWQGPRLREFRLPTIAMVNGYCFGGAFVPLVSCDLAIAAEDAVFGLSEVNWGIAPAGNVPIALLQTMGIRDAMYYTITAETFDGRKASQMGLVNEAVPSERLQARVLEIADVLKAKNLAVVRHAKEMLRYLRTMGFAEAQQYIDAKGRVGVVTDPERGREQGLKQFLDNKSYKPGFEAYTRG
jgi:trans-feruloyl-CoA hydratase/vanillin synthase